MAAPKLATLQSIRQEAGLQHQNFGEELAGDANGTNTVFLVNDKYIVDRDESDTAVSATDVTVTVNDAVVGVSSVNGVTGAITLSGAPASDAVVKADYAYSVLSDTEATRLRKEGVGWLRNAVKDFIAYDDLIEPVDGTPTDLDYPPEFNTILRLYCAALLLIQDYGSSADTDLSSKDGYKKLGIAKSMLKDWIESRSSDADNPKTLSPVSKSDGELFRRNRELGEGGFPTTICPTTDQFFHHDDCY